METLSFGAWVRQRRTEYFGWTQARLAEEAGCSLRTIQKIEAGHHEPARNLAEKIAARLEMAAAERHLFFAGPQPAPAAPAWAAPIPQARVPLLGRAPEVAAAMALLAPPQVRLLTLTGAGGIGKTRLAVHIGETVKTTGARPVQFVDLSPIRDPTLVPAAIADALQVRESSGRGLQDSLKDYLRARDLLLVLDNFEQVLTAAALLTDLLDAAPGLTLLITSREVLRIEYESEFPVPALAVPGAAERDLTRLATAPAVQLFVARARAVDARFHLTAENAPAIAAICARLDGLPLAIELAAARIAQFPPSVLLARLDKRLALLTGGARDQPRRHQTLEAAIGWSCDLLDRRARQLFTRLAICTGGCTLDAVAALYPAEGPGALRALLDGLADKSLVEQSLDPAGAHRYRMLETIREYALAQLAASGDQPAAAAGHAVYYQALAAQAVPHLAGAQQAHWLRRLETDHDNLRAALHWALDGGRLEAAGHLAAALWRFWRLRGHWAEGRRWLAAVLPGAVPGPQRAALLVGAGQLAEDQGDHAEAQAALEESLALYRTQGDQRGEATVLSLLGIVARAQRREKDRSDALLAQSLALWQQLGDKAGQANVQMLLGVNALAHRDQLPAARRYYEESLHLSRQVEDPAALALILYRLGMVLRELEGPRAARPYYEESLAIGQELGDPRGIGNAQMGLARIAWLAGNYARARELYAHCLGVYQEIGFAAGIGSVLLYTGQMLAELGELAQARQDLTQADAIFAQHNFRTNQADVLFHLGATYRATGDWIQAEELYTSSYMLYSEMEWPTGMAASRLALAPLALRRGDSQAGAAFYLESWRAWHAAANATGLAQLLLVGLELVLDRGCLAVGVALWQALAHRWAGVAERLEPPHRAHYTQLTRALHQQLGAPLAAGAAPPDLEQIVAAAVTCLRGSAAGDGRLSASAEQTG